MAKAEFKGFGTNVVGCKSSKFLVENLFCQERFWKTLKLCFLGEVTSV